MPKQGQFARSNKKKVIKNFKRSVRKQTRTINNDMVSDFMVVRYNLTLKKHFNPLTGETIQRFLQELMPRLVDQDFNFKTAVQTTITYVSARVPWQFYYLLSKSWNDLLKFLKRELPALPLKNKVIITDWINQEQLDQQIAQVLAKQVMTMMLLKSSSNSQVQQSLSKRLLGSIVTNQQINWGIVKTLLVPFKFSINDQLDAGTKKWLLDLMRSN